MAYVTDKLTGKGYFFTEVATSSSSATSPDSGFVTNDVSTSQEITADTGYNLYRITTGASDLTFTFTTPPTDIIYRIYKDDDSSGTISVLDHDGVEIICLINYQEWIDVLYTSSTKYTIM